MKSNSVYFKNKISILLIFSMLIISTNCEKGPSACECKERLEDSQSKLFGTTVEAEKRAECIDKFTDGKLQKNTEIENLERKIKQAEMLEKLAKQRIDKLCNE